MHGAFGVVDTLVDCGQTSCHFLFRPGIDLLWRFEVRYFLVRLGCVLNFSLYCATVCSLFYGLPRTTTRRVEVLRGSRRSPSSYFGRVLLIVVLGLVVGNLSRGGGARPHRQQISSHVASTYSGSLRCLGQLLLGS